VKVANVTQWVRWRKPSIPTRPKASHQVGSQVEGRSPRGGVRNRDEARRQAASLNLENCIMVDSRISLGDQTQSRRSAWAGRQQSCLRQGERAGHHRGLRAGHVFTGVTRELGRASRLLGSSSRREDDRQEQHPGDYWPTRLMDEPTSARVERNTNNNASTQGTGREPKANRPGRTKAVVATHSTVGQGGNPSPDAWGTKAQGTHDKGRKAAGRQCWDMASVPGKGRMDIEPNTCLYETGLDCTKLRGQEFAVGGAATAMSPVV
jgi:hypothetical protein